MEISLSQKISNFESQKGQANEIFKTGDMKAAKKAFEALLLDIEKLVNEIPNNHGDYGKLKTLYLQVGSNKALADFKTNEIDDCLAVCEKVLALEPTHEKCLYRRALCLITKAEQSSSSANHETILNFYKKSRGDLETVLRIDKSNKEVEAKLTTVVRAIIKLETENNITQPKVSKKVNEKIKDITQKPETEKPHSGQGKTIKMPAGIPKEKFENIVNNAVSQTTSDLISSSDLPQTATSFELNCQAFKKTVDKLYFYLKKVPPTHIKKLYQNSELNPDLLLLIFKTIGETGINDDAVLCLDLLQTLTITNKFHILIKQLVKSEKKYIAKVIEDLFKVASIEEKEEKCDELLEKYGCKDLI